MPSNIYRGDAPAVDRVYRLLAPPVAAVEVSITVGNKTIVFERWNRKEIIDGWNASPYPEMNEITISEVVRPFRISSTAGHGTTKYPARP